MYDTTTVQPRWRSALQRRRPVPGVAALRPDRSRGRPRRWLRGSRGGRKSRSAVRSPRSRTWWAVALVRLIAVASCPSSLRRTGFSTCLVASPSPSTWAIMCFAQPRCARADRAGSSRRSSSECLMNWTVRTPGRWGGRSPGRCPGQE